MLDREQIKQVIADQRKMVLDKPLGVERSLLKQMENKIKLPHVVVITGLRRAGKSTFLRQIMKRYYQDRDFYYLNFEDERLFGFQAADFNILYETLLGLYGEKKVFFIDEIQNVDHYESFVRRFYDAGFKFFITGSNARMLSKELGTKLTGRHIDLVISPFSFVEYLHFKGTGYNEERLLQTEGRAEIKKRFEEYLFSGGMPEYLQYRDPEILTRIYEDIVIKDIAVRYKVGNLHEMRGIYLSLISNFANRFSFHSIRKVSGLGSVTTVRNYIFFLEETCFISLVNKFDYSIKKQLVNEKKAYPVDNGFIRALSARTGSDKGWLLENMVFNILNDHRQEVYYHQGKNECDFVIKQERVITGAIQVTSELTDRNEKREVNGLLEAMGQYGLKQGLILTLDQRKDIRSGDKNILVRPTWQWMLEKA